MTAWRMAAFCSSEERVLAAAVSSSKSRAEAALAPPTSASAWRPRFILLCKQKTAYEIQKLDRRWYVFAFVANRRCQAQSNGPSEFPARPADHQPVGRFYRVRGRLSSTRWSTTSPAPRHGF